MRKQKIAATIDIGSNTVRMHISQWDGRQVLLLDRLEMPTQIGKEVFSTGYITFDTVQSLSSVISGFCEKAKEYGISAIFAVASTALREAANKAYILDHLLTRSKLDVHVLEDTEVSALMLNAVKNSEVIPAGGTLLVNGGTGTTDFELLKNDKVVLAHSINTGLLKIAEMMREADGLSHNTGVIAEEYLDTFLTKDNRIQDLWKTDSIMFITSDLQPLYKLCGIQAGSSAVLITRDELLRLYQTYRMLSVEQMCSQHGFDIQSGGMLYAMLALLASLLRLTDAQKLSCAEANIADAMQNILLIPGARKKYNENLRKGAVASAIDLAKRYRCDMKHGNYVAHIAMKLFEELKALIGLTAQRGHLLQIASILHEAGYYVNSADVVEASFDLVRDAHIYGLTSAETLMAANIIAPRNLPRMTRGGWRGGALYGKDIQLAAKLHAIMNLAKALDYSRKQKASLTGVNLKGVNLVISIKINDDYTLEQLRFKESAALFREIFGITPVLKAGNMYNY